jgi:hypothetical protein
MDLIRKAIDSKIAALGLDWLKLQSFKIHPKEKTLTATVMLDGEMEPIHLEASYALSGNQFKVLAVRTSRKWVTEAARLALAKTGGTFDLPTGMTGTMIRMLL